MKFFNANIALACKDTDHLIVVDHGIVEDCFVLTHCYQCNNMAVVMSLN